MAEPQPSSRIQIIDKYMAEAPVNIEAMAKDLGLGIMIADLGEDISGVIKKDSMFGGKSGYLIMVNQRDAQTRQRFTIAHELAHFLLHETYIGDGIKEDAMYRSANQNMSDAREKEANGWAAGVLIPNALVSKLMEEYNGDKTLVAKKLEVSPQALGLVLDNRKNVR